MKTDKKMTAPDTISQLIERWRMQAADAERVGLIALAVGLRECADQLEDVSRNESNNEGEA